MNIFNQETYNVRSLLIEGVDVPTRGLKLKTANIKRAIHILNTLRLPSSRTFKWVDEELKEATEKLLRSLAYMLHMNYVFDKHTLVRIRDVYLTLYEIKESYVAKDTSTKAANTNTDQINAELDELRKTYFAKFSEISKLPEHLERRQTSAVKLTAVLLKILKLLKKHSSEKSSSESFVLLRMKRRWNFSERGSFRQRFIPEKRYPKKILDIPLPFDFELFATPKFAKHLEKAIELIQEIVQSNVELMSESTTLSILEAENERLKFFSSLFNALMSANLDVMLDGNKEQYQQELLSLVEFIHSVFKTGLLCEITHTSQKLGVHKIGYFLYQVDNFGDILQMMRIYVVGKKLLPSSEHILIASLSDIQRIRKVMKSLFPDAVVREPQEIPVDIVFTTAIRFDPRNEMQANMVANLSEYDSTSIRDMHVENDFGFYFGISDGTMGLLPSPYEDISKKEVVGWLENNIGTKNGINYDNVLWGVEYTSQIVHTPIYEFLLGLNAKKFQNPIMYFVLVDEYRVPSFLTATREGENVYKITEFMGEKVTADIYIVRLMDVPHRLFSGLIKYSGLPNVVTGDHSLNDCINFQKPFFYIPQLWKTSAMLELKELFSVLGFVDVSRAFLVHSIIATMLLEETENGIHSIQTGSRNELGRKISKISDQDREKMSRAIVEKYEQNWETLREEIMEMSELFFASELTKNYEKALRRISIIDDSSPYLFATVLRHYDLTKGGILTVKKSMIDSSDVDKGEKLLQDASG